MKGKKMVCHQCKWGGPPQDTIREIKHEEQIKERKRDEETGEVYYEPSDPPRYQEVWTRINRQVKFDSQFEKDQEVRYRCPACKAKLREG